MNRRAFLGGAASIVAAAAVGVGSAGCSKKNAHGDDATRAPATRIVSISASTTEAVFAIGAGDRLVGRSRYCDYPPEVRALPAVGGYTDPNLEAILALRPDLVVGARGPLGPDIVRVLEDHGIATYFPETESFDRITEMIEGIGARVRLVDRAHGVVERMRARRAAIESALGTLDRPRVLLLFSVRPITCAGPKSFPDEMIRLAGGANAIAEGAAYPTIGLEKVLAVDPDVIIDAEMGADAGSFDETWRDVRAVREKRVARIDDEAVLRPGPRVLDGVATLARVIHPGVQVP